jgi:hypothetical protein
VEPPKPARVTPTAITHLDDQAILAKVRTAKNADKFAALFDQAPAEGDTRTSEDDLALADILAFYSQDPAQLRRLLEASARRRAKWDTRRGASTWLDVYVIDKALSDLGATYSGGQTWDSIPPPDSNPHDAGRPAEPIPIMTGGGTCGQCPLAATPTVIARLEARVRELEAERRRLAQEVGQLRAERSAVFDVLRNPNLKAEARTALATVAVVGSALSRGQAAADGRTRLPLARIAEASGQSPDTCSKHLQRLDQDYQFVERHYTRTDDGRKALHVTVPALAEGIPATLRALASLKPAEGHELPKHGGKRIPRCPDCPGAIVREEHRFICTGCGTVLLTDVTEHPPAEAKPQDAAWDAAAADPIPPATSVEATYLDTASCRVAPEPIVRPCDQCSRPALPNGERSCEHPRTPPPPAPALDVDPEPPLPPPAPADDDVGWCTRHRRALQMYGEVKHHAVTGEWRCETCAKEADTTPLAEVG